MAPRASKPAPVATTPAATPVATPATPAATPATPATKQTPPVAPKVTKGVTQSAPADIADATKETVVEDAESHLSVIDKLESKISALLSSVKDIVQELKAVKKEYKTLKDKVDRVERKRAKAISNPNGFAKPCKIKNELCDFLAVPHGSEMSRTDVTRGVNAYIKKLNLNKPENKRYIVPDEKLRSLLGVKPTEEVSYFQLQRYLSPHFIKEIKPVAPAASA